ncbi:hypothetical protein PQX77_001311 [Marasmius sp. AFHP31]|nr:hypothetical protein PQX77_001311 [Marasmius sp. AFHP31]
MVLTQKTYQIVEGIDIFFTDTGAPPSSTEYTTMVIVHGLGFPGAGFEPLQTQALSSNLRVIALNRRDYPGSTPFSDVELEALHSGNGSRAQEFHANLGLHLWLFLKKLIEEEDVPPISTKVPAGAQRSGGIVLMGWSLGVAFTLPAFANPKVVGDNYKLLERYIKALIIYDPSCGILGYSIPSNIDADKLYVPWTDSSAKNPQERFDKFVSWVCSRYRYEYADGNDAPTIDSLERTGVLERTEDCFAKSLPKDELEKLTYPPMFLPTRGDMTLLAKHQSVLENATRKVLFDEDIAKTFFPNLSITYLYPPHTVWMCVLAYMETKRIYEELSAVRAIRPVKFVELKGADHFAHYEDPQGFLQAIEEVLV